MEGGQQGAVLTLRFQKFWLRTPCQCQFLLSHCTTSRGRQLAVLQTQSGKAGEGASSQAGKGSRRRKPSPRAWLSFAFTGESNTAEGG